MKVLLPIITPMHGSRSLFKQVLFVGTLSRKLSPGFWEGGIEGRREGENTNFLVRNNCSSVAYVRPSRRSDHLPKAGKVSRLAEDSTPLSRFQISPKEETYAGGMRSLKARLFDARTRTCMHTISYARTLIRNSIVLRKGERFFN